MKASSRPKALWGDRPLRKGGRLLVDDRFRRDLSYMRLHVMFDQDTQTTAVDRTRQYNRYRDAGQYVQPRMPMPATLLHRRSPTAPTGSSWVPSSGG